eukprot:5959436-Pleurochrysis_carterae.AAC.1
MDVSMIAVVARHRFSKFCKHASASTLYFFLPTLVSPRRISIPLVWRYVRLPEENNRVRVQFMASLSDGDKFEKSEWGPWINKKMSRNNPPTGIVEEVWVSIFCNTDFCMLPPQHLCYVDHRTPWLSVLNVWHLWKNAGEAE